MIKVRYNSETSLVNGYFDSNTNYLNNNIDSVANTIDGDPYIEITDECHQDNISNIMCVIDGLFQEYVKPDNILLQESKEAKKSEIKALRDSEFCKPLQVRSNPDIYLKPQPQVNIFLAAYSMDDAAVKEWYTCDVNGNITNTSIEATKAELISVANHYEDRKTNEYNQCHKRKEAVDALTTIEEVEAFDINEVIV